MKIFLLIIFFLFSWAKFIQADTILKIKTEDGNISEIISNGKNTRISMAPEPGYVLINHTAQKMYMVLPEEKTIMNISVDSTKGSTPIKVDIKLSEVGKGPKIAGYSTKKYNLTADGQDCGTIFGSKAALNNKDVNHIFQAINEMMDNQSQMMGAASQMMDACERAEMNLAAQTKITGLPLRTLDTNGALTSEIQSINTREKLPANAFELPSDYTMTSMSEEMQNMQQQMQEQIQQQMPDMEKMMQQMGKSGQMPPEAMEEMKRMQEMMKQFQQ